MIPLIVRHQTDNHIRDTDAENLPRVADTYKKGAPLRITADHKTALTIHGDTRNAPSALGLPPPRLPLRQVEVG